LAAAPAEAAVEFAAPVAIDPAPSRRRFGGVDHHAEDIGIAVICYFVIARLRNHIFNDRILIATYAEGREE
jgi:hypothetical protein